MGVAHATLEERVELVSQISFVEHGLRPLQHRLAEELVRDLLGSADARGVHQRFTFGAPRPLQAPGLAQEPRREAAREVVAQRRRRERAAGLVQYDAGVLYSRDADVLRRRKAREQQGSKERPRHHVYRGKWLVGQPNLMPDLLHVRVGKFPRRRATERSRRWRGGGVFPHQHAIAAIGARPRPDSCHIDGEERLTGARCRAGTSAACPCPRSIKPTGRCTPHENSGRSLVEYGRRRRSPNFRSRSRSSRICRRTPFLNLGARGTPGPSGRGAVSVH
mmetsp:Transcript_7078/g.18328  ORF Transcript_7078/g.18328 Transcript_7078/m.18328 type:complete len:277 (+) Transcript_7078:639-1469(+)